MDTQVLVIGGGIAGSIAALGLAEKGADVVILRPSPSAAETASFHAQGGIVYKGAADSPQSRFEDIWNAGGCCGDREMIRMLAEDGPEAIERILIDRLNISFDRSPQGELSLTKEAAHSCPRIIHNSDATGKAVMETLQQAVSGHPGITLMTGCIATDLIMSGDLEKKCHGASIIDSGGSIDSVRASITIMATGGAGSLYKRTSNPYGAKGHGAAMAARVGAETRDLEYMQFHPTALALPGIKPFLISEAVRGAGARLVTPSNVPFMNEYSPQWEDLAARDVVARAILLEMKKEGTPHVCLNFFEYIPTDVIKDRFPTIYSRCMLHGIDITRELLPVTPAAHFICGGISVDEWAQTSVPGLFAVGECSCTGVHGANRLASTSLLEGVVWADRAVRRISTLLEKNPDPLLSSSSVSPDDKAGAAEMYHELQPQIQNMEQRIQRIMWDKVGILRNYRDLGDAVYELKEMKDSAENMYSQGLPAAATASLRNMAGTAVMVAESALKNRVSRGCHYIVS